MIKAIALDLGTTRIKAALLDDHGSLLDVMTTDAPGLSGEDPVRESDSLAYANAAQSLLAQLSCTENPPLGIASQRSSFLLWERKTGQPLTPLISWQDRRAAQWCCQLESVEEEIIQRTGLRLSAHYAGPKLAFLFEHHPELARKAANNEILFGPLDCFLIWKWSGGRLHHVDLSMASRTLLADPVKGQWSKRLTDLFGVHLDMLPKIVPTVNRHDALDFGFVVTSSIADQAASTLAVLGGEKGDILVNLGTGVFVLQHTGTVLKRITGYLSGPLGKFPAGAVYAIEGTINGGGPTADRFTRDKAILPCEDPTQDAFALPDEAGIGAPHWRPRIQMTFSEGARQLEGTDLKRIVLEGVIFRIKEIITDLTSAAPPGRILLAGGLARDPFLGQGLASCLNQEVLVCQEQEGTLLGAAKMASGLDLCASSSKIIIPSQQGRYLAEKYAQWQRWMETVLTRA